MSKINTSIIVPIYNESRHIENCINSIIESTDDIETMELLLIDGGSTDGTLERLKNFEKMYSFIRVLNNDKKKIAPALNLGINNSSGKYIVRLDAHSKFPKRYINNLVDALDNLPDEVVNVGGALDTKPGGNSIIAKSIAIALSSKIGVGNSDFRTKEINEPQYVSTVPWGAYRRQALQEVGLFDESVPASEDLELSQKLIANGMKIMMIPDVRATLFTRENFPKLIKQMFDNGRSVTKENKTSISFYRLRHYVPFFFVSYLCFLLLSNIFLFPLIPGIYTNIFMLPLILYFILILLEGGFRSIKEMQPIYLAFVPLTLFIIHFSYGFGSIYGLFQRIIPSLPNLGRR